MSELKKLAGVILKFEAELPVVCHWRIQRRRQGRPRGSKFFHFHAVFGEKKLENNNTFGSWDTPSGKSWIRHCMQPKFSFCFAKSL